jgi:protein TonB
METKALVVRTWDDLVFSSRNREYGAYSIRKAYSRNLLMGLGISTALIAGLFLAGNLIREVKSGNDIPVFTGCRLKLDPPPIIEPRLRIQPMTRTETVRRTGTTIRVVSEPVADVPMETEPVVSSSEGSTTGTDIPLAGDVTGMGDIPVVVPEEPKEVLIAEVMPVYEGGYAEMLRFLQSKLRYPASARRIGTEGTVYVQFVVNGDGTVRNVTVLRGISAACDEEAVRVISMLPGWIGGKQNGNPVAVRMVLPVKFSLAK